MTCKEKIDEIAEMLNDAFATNIERIERIREIVDEAEDKTIRLDKVKQAREEIENLETQIQSYHNDNPMISQSDVLEIIDKLIEEVE